MRIFLCTLAILITGFKANPLFAQTENLDMLLHDSETGLDYLPDKLVLTFYDDYVPNRTRFSGKNSVIGYSDIDNILRDFRVESIEPVTASIDNIQILSCNACNVSKLKSKLSSLKKYFEFVEYYLIGKTTACPGGESVDDPVDNAVLLNQINAECAWGLTTGGNSIVGLVDNTGNGLDNPDIQSKVISNNNITNNSFRRHGHQMGGLIGAETDNGLSIPAIGHDTEMRTYNIAVNEVRVSSTAARIGVNQAVNDGVDVINMSFTWSNLGSMKQAVDNAVAQGVTVVTAAGNDTYNKGCDNIGVICVTSVDENDKHEDIRPDGDDRTNASSAAVDLTAPDRGFRSLKPISGTQIMYRGTSASSAIVSATVALMYDIDPFITPAKAKSYLECSADNISNVANNGTTYNGLLGAGRLNTYRAVQQAKIDASIMSGPTFVCTNSYYTYSVPNFDDATYNWTLSPGATFTTGNNGRSVEISVNNSSNISIECTITVGNCTQVKTKILVSCGGGWMVSSYPNPTNGKISASLYREQQKENTEYFSKQQSPAFIFTLFNPYGREVRRVEVEANSKEEVLFDLTGMRSGIYTLRVTYEDEVLTERISLE